MKIRKFVAGLCISGMILTQGVAAFASTYHSDPDFGEKTPNNTLEEAYEQRTTSISKDSPGYIFGMVSRYDKSDYFKVEPEELGTICFKLYNGELGQDFDLYLYDEEGNIIVTGTEYSTEDPSYDLIELTDFTPGESYYILIKYVSNPSESDAYILKYYYN